MITKSTTTNNTHSNTQRTTLFLHSALTKQARAQAVVEDVTFTALVEKALITYLPKETVIKKPLL